MYSILTDGNAYVQIIRDNSANPVQLLPMNPDYVNIFIKDNELFYQKDGGPALDSSDVLHIKLITDDGIEGLSPIDQCAKAINWSLSMEEFGSTFFKNGAKPSSSIIN